MTITRKQSTLSSSFLRTLVATKVRCSNRRLSYVHMTDSRKRLCMRPSQGARPTSVITLTLSNGCGFPPSPIDRPISVAHRGLLLVLDRRLNVFLTQSVSKLVQRRCDTNSIFAFLGRTLRQCQCRFHSSYEWATRDRKGASTIWSEFNRMSLFVSEVMASYRQRSSYLTCFTEQKVQRICRPVLTYRPEARKCWKLLRYLDLYFYYEPIIRKIMSDMCMSLRFQFMLFKHLKKKS